MGKICRPLRGMQYKRIGENRILFEFFSKKDYDRVCDGRPWSFDKKLLIIQQYDGEVRPSEIMFNHSFVDAYSGSSCNGNE